MVYIGNEKKACIRGKMVEDDIREVMMVPDIIGLLDHCMELGFYFK